MEKKAPCWEWNGYRLRLAQADDAEEYYRQNFDPLDDEIARLTGCKTEFSREEVVTFFLQCLQAPDRYDFLLIAPEGRIIGESVVNEIDGAAKSANYRVALFHPADRGRGLGSWMVRQTRDFTFETLGLHRLSLDVFSYNKQAERVYCAAGFRREGVLRDAVWDGTAYADDILMAILQDEWRKTKIRDAKSSV